MELFDQTKSYALLILGQSGSGKSYLAGVLAKHLDKPIFLVNASAEDFQNLPKIQARLQFENLNLAKIKNSTVITDDILQLTDNFNLKLKELLCYSVHHWKNNAIAIGHSLHNTGIFALLNFFNLVVLTNSPRNVKDFHIISKVWGLDPECTVSFHNFVEGSSKYFVISGATKKCTTLDKELTPPNFDETPEKNVGISQKREKVMKIMNQGFSNLQLSGVLFDWIFTNFNSDFLSISDLSITLQNGATTIEVSFVDYLYFLQTLEKPSLSVVNLHRYFLKHFSFPLAFVKNPDLRKLA